MLTPREHSCGYQPVQFSLSIAVLVSVNIYVGYYIIETLLPLRPSSDCEVLRSGSAVPGSSVKLGLFDPESRPALCLDPRSANLTRWLKVRRTEGSKFQRVSHRVD